MVRLQLVQGQATTHLQDALLAAGNPALGTSASLLGTSALLVSNKKLLEFDSLKEEAAVYRCGKGGERCSHLWHQSCIQEFLARYPFI